jgi:outer membrane protein OmpA-like peptidoglycan-associated protein/tetratricopeptide (TPR) repeat protein
MKSRITFLIVLICLSGMQTIQANIRKANRYFELYKYSQAIPLYKKSLSSSNMSVKKEATEKLGDCYRLINDVREAQLWYARAVTFPHPKPIMYYYLGNTLKSTEQYEQAKSAFLKYAELNPSDPKGHLLADYCDSIKTLATISSGTEIKNALGLNTPYSEFSPVFYRKALVFTSDRKPAKRSEMVDDWTNNSYLDLYITELKKSTENWLDFSDPIKMTKVFNQAYHDGPASFTADFKTVFITRTYEERSNKERGNITTNRLQILYARITGSKHLRYQNLPFNNPKYSVAHPAISENGRKLIFSSDMPGGFGGSDLYFSEYKVGGWTKPENLGPAVNTFGNEVFPYWLNDSVLFFSSDGHLGFGGLDLYRTNLNHGNWTAPDNLLKPLNSSYDDFGIVYFPQEDAGLFSSNRPGGWGSDDIYFFRKSDVVKPPMVASALAPKTETTLPKACGYVLDKQSSAPINKATIFLLFPGTGEVVIALTNASGFFQIPVKIGTRYFYKAMKQGYFDDCLACGFSIADSVKTLTLPRNLFLDKCNLNQSFKIEDIYYDLDKWDIKQESRLPLDNIIRLMEQYPINIELSSHTDSRASSAYNLELSQKRAEAARNYMIAKGISPARIIAIGYGETRLLNHCSDGIICSEVEHQVNRRSEFKITSIDSPNFSGKALDLNPFREGDKLSVEMFDPDFFSSCFSVRKFQSAEKEPEKKIAEKIPSGIKPAGKEIPEKVIEQSKISEETYFTIQIAAGKPSTGANMVNTRGESFFTKEIGGYTKYYIGKFEDFPNVVKEQNRLRNKFPGAFIVAFYKGAVVPVSELKGKLKNNM